MKALLTSFLPDQPKYMCVVCVVLCLGRAVGVNNLNPAVVACFTFLFLLTAAIEIDLCIHIYIDMVDFYLTLFLFLFVPVWAVSAVDPLFCLRLLF